MSDLAAKIAALKAKKAAEAQSALALSSTIKPVEIKNETANSNIPTSPITSPDLVASNTFANVQAVAGGVALTGPTTVTVPIPVPTPVPASTVGTVGAGTARTTDINTLDFLSKVQDLEQAILGKHPKMPVLLALIHKQIAADPELVTTLSEEEIGVIVNGLKQQTKTELVGTILKQSKSREKKTALSTDMF